MRFRKSRLVISPIAPLGIGALVGFLAAVMGVGGGFVMIPAMIYLLRMPANVVVGTSLFQIVFVTAAVTVLHAINTQTVDVVLAALLLVGAVVGAQFGVRVGRKLKGEQLRALLALMVLAVCLRMAFGLFVTPDELFLVNEDID
ncbi:MAG: sulfite exporter TauE/SafE family protein, partial [Alphaproteobacteria bacterium]